MREDFLFKEIHFARVRIKLFGKRERVGKELRLLKEKRRDSRTDCTERDTGTLAKEGEGMQGPQIGTQTQLRNLTFDR